MRARDLDLLVTAAQTSGDIAQRYFQKDPNVTHKPNDAGPVTEADLEIDEYLRTHLCEQRPDYAWLSEETDDDISRLDQDTVFIVDPIDGTRAFIEGSSHWGHSLAIAHKGVVEVAAVFMPVIGKMFTATRTGGAFLNCKPIHASDRDETKGACILAAKANFNADNWKGGFPDIRRNFRSSLAYRLCLVGEGAFDGMLTLRPTWEWDVAAGHLIATEAGATSTDQNGNALSFNTPQGCNPGMVTAAPKVHTGLIKALTGS